jgi:hypothetical protein
VDVIVKRYVEQVGNSDDAYVLRDGQKLTFDEAIAAMPKEESA